MVCRGAAQPLVDPLSAGHELHCRRTLVRKLPPSDRQVAVKDTSEGVSRQILEHRIDEEAVRSRRPGKSWDERPRTLFGTDAGHAVERSALRAEHAETASEQATVERDSERLEGGRRRRGRRPGRGRDATTLVGADRRRWSGR
jgi:hypothetical protein